MTLSDSQTAFESVLFLQKHILQTRKSAAFGRGFLSARGAPISLSHFLLNGQIEDSLILNNTRRCLEVYLYYAIPPPPTPN